MSGERFARALFTTRPPEERAAWFNFAAQNMEDASALLEAGLTGGYGNVFEHSLVVGAGSQFMAAKLAASGISIDVPRAKKGGLLHDLAKGQDKAIGVDYDTEQEQSKLEPLLIRFGYSLEVIATAQYTGRVANLYIEDSDEQRVAIETVPPEFQTVGYIDARTRNTNIVSLEEARELNKDKNPDEEEFYDRLWYPYYLNLEESLFHLAGNPAFTPERINDEAVVGMVKELAQQA